MSNSIPVNTELAWAAGFFDGEGNAHFCRNSRTVGLSVTQTSLPELQRFQSTLGVGRVYGPYINKGPRNNPHWQYRIKGFQHYQHAMCLLWRFLCQRKKDQLKRAQRSWLEAHPA